MGRHPPLVEECMSSLIVVQAAWYGLMFPTCCVRMYFRSDYGSGRMVQVDVPHLLCKNVFQV